MPLTKEPPCWLNMDEEYKMGDAVLGRTTQEKDLGVTFSADMKVS